MDESRRLNPIADLLVTRASVWSDGARLPGVDCVAVADGRVLATGSAVGLEPLRGPRTRVVDAAFATVTPGLCDAHIHMLQWARALEEIDLLGSADRDEAARRVGAFAASRPLAGVLVGRGWDANRWNEPPHRQALDAVSPGRPVVLHSKDFHAVWLNSAALAACGIDRGTLDPEGGVVWRDASGEPTGLLQEHAVRLAVRLLETVQHDDAAAAVHAAGRLHAAGVTAIHDFEDAHAQRVLRDLTRGDAPPLRVLMHLTHAGIDPARELGLHSGVGDDTFRIGAIKLFADGTLGSRTAAMLAPYDGGDATGLDLMPRDELRAVVERAFAAGLSVAVHAIGDRAVRHALDAFAAAGQWIPRLALPPRIEHLQLVDSADLDRFAALGVAASMQPQHCVADIELAERHWGAVRCRHSYPWRAMLDRGVTLAFGSDAPVEPPTPGLGLFSAVHRSGRDGRTFVAEQAITLDQALSGYTSGAARLAGAWPRLGTLRAGACADLVVWNQDLHAAGAGALAAAHAVCTVMDGRIVHLRPAVSVSGAGLESTAGRAA